MKRLYGDRPIPEGFNLAEELIRRVQSGSLSLAPNPESGWYDYQTWALEPLVAPERAPEIARLRLSRNYRRHLEELFKGLLALTRETHVKQLEMAMAGCAAPFGRPPIWISPGLTAEPLATYYLRRAQAYRFARGVLDDAFGPSWREIPLHGADDKRSVAEALEAMEGLFQGAYIVVSSELGMEPDRSLLAGRDGASDEAAFRAWSQTSAHDPDLARDTRMMVPVFYDILRRKIKVWALLGWSHRAVTIGYARQPRVLSVKKGFLQRPRIEFVAQGERAAFPVTAEVYVDRLLNRDEFRRLCDRCRSQASILAALQPAA